MGMLLLGGNSKDHIRLVFSLNWHCATSLFLILGSNKKRQIIHTARDASFSRELVIPTGSELNDRGHRCREVPPPNDTHPAPPAIPRPPGPPRLRARPWGTCVRPRWTTSCCPPDRHASLQGFLWFPSRVLLPSCSVPPRTSVVQAPPRPLHYLTHCRARELFTLLENL